MFVTGHPTTMTFSPLKHLRRFSSHSDSPPPKSPVDTLNDPLCCQLQLITALQGAEFDDTARHSLAMTIAKMQAAKRTALIQFITQGYLVSALMSTSQKDDPIALSAPMAIGWQSAIPAAMENNACKAFECATSDLDTILDEHNVTALSDLWHKTHTQIIPTLQAMLYPLQDI
ncbi:unnamed protein product [Anisakis simplex]|uniref:DUF4439 domain-containing protein n=1 Tax=Anisakis simplex TaxID=6269 RepID=A0A0M3IZ88_ANISI|nr:unnamed protein product [Anisakis simplex]